MTGRDVLIIRNGSGELVGAQVLVPEDGQIVSYITPSDREHTVHRVADVPEEIWAGVHPTDFPARLTEHLDSPGARVVKTSTEELHALYSAGGPANEEG